jgi:hypothetical protein
MFGRFELALEDKDRRAVPKRLLVTLRFRSDFAQKIEQYKAFRLAVISLVYRPLFIHTRCTLTRRQSIHRKFDNDQYTKKLIN